MTKSFKFVDQPTAEKPQKPMESKFGKGKGLVVKKMNLPDNDEYSDQELPVGEKKGS